MPAAALSEPARPGGQVIGVRHDRFQHAHAPSSRPSPASPPARARRDASAFRARARRCVRQGLPSTPDRRAARRRSPRSCGASSGRTPSLELSLDGKKLLAMIRDFALHPVQRSLEHVDFVEVKLDRPVDVEVPLVATGKAAGVAKGGVLRIVLPPRARAVPSGPHPGEARDRSHPPRARRAHHDARPEAPRRASPCGCRQSRRSSPSSPRRRKSKRRRSPARLRRQPGRGARRRRRRGAAAPAADAKKDDKKDEKKK